MIIIWCISITNNVKSYKKNHRNSSNIQFQWFPIDSLWKWSKRDQNYPNANAFFSDWKISLRYSGYAIGKLTSRAFWKCGGFGCYNFFKPELWLVKVGSNFKKKNCQIAASKKKDTATIFRFRFCHWISLKIYLMGLCWFNMEAWIEKL